MTDQPDITTAVDRIINLVQNAIDDTPDAGSEPLHTPAHPAPPPAASPGRPHPNLALGNFLQFAQPPPKPPAIPSDPGLPSDLLPPVVESWLQDTAILAGVPPVMTTAPFLAYTGGVIGNRLGLQLHQGWVEYPALWIALVALSGMGKTPALQAASHPFNLLHDEMRLASGARDGQWAPPLVVGRASWPRLERALSLSNGLILRCDELVGLLNVLSGRANETRQQYLSLWATDHIFRHQKPTIHHPVLSIVGGIQPLMVNRIRHRQPDGLMERFLLVVASAKAGPWKPTLTSVPDIEPILGILRSFRARETTHHLTFDPAATRLWEQWYDAHDSLFQEIDPEHLVPLGFYRKYPTHLARITVVLHALWHHADPTVPVRGETIDRAITLIEYLRIQHHRSMAFINQRHAVMNPGNALTGRILDLLSRPSHTDCWVPRSRLAAQLNDPPSAHVSSALDDLVGRNLIETRTTKTPGRPAREYRLVASESPG